MALDAGINFFNTADGYTGGQSEEIRRYLKDNFQESLDLAAALRASAPKGLTWYYEPRPDLRHSTIYRGASPGVFRKLFPPATKAAPSTAPPS